LEFRKPIEYTAEHAADYRWIRFRIVGRTEFLYHGE